MKEEKRFIDKLKTYLLYAGPTTFIFFTVIILPFLFGIYLTFTSWDGISNSYNLVGFSNYIEAFKDMKFLSSFGLTLKYVLYTVVLTNVIAFLFAYILTSGMKGQNFFRAGFLLLT